MVKVLDQYYFREFTTEALSLQLEKAVTVRPDITTRDQLCQLISTEQNVELPSNSLQWHLWILPEYEA